MTRHWSFRTRFVLMASLCLLPLLLVLVYVVQESLNESRDKTIENEVAIGEVIAKNVTQTLDENIVVLTDIASIDAVRALDPQQAQATLGQFLRARPSLYGMLLISADGRELVASSGNLDPNPVLPLLKGDLDTLFTVGEPIITGLLPPDVSEGSGTVGLIVPVRVDPTDTATEAEAGVPVGALVGLLNIERLGRSFNSAFSIAQTDTVAAVVAGNQVIVSQANTEQTGEALVSDLSAPIAAAVAGKRSNLTYSAGGEERVAIFAPVEYPGANWAVVVTNPAPTVSGESRDFIVRALVALGMAVISTLAMAMLLGEVVSRPIRRLTGQTAAIAHGDYSRPVDITGSGEIVGLSEAVGEMADRLTTQVRDLDSARIEVAAQAERLRDLLRRTVRLQEDERRRIAGDIHDAVSPLITGALYQTRAIQLGSGNGEHAATGTNGSPEQDAENLTAITELLERAMDELHSVIFALRPPDLDDLGVEAAIERYVQQIDRNGLPCQFEVVGEARRLSPEARLAVYRIVQEALHNALRHAHADAALVRMEWTDDLLRVTISDNGSGFDPDQASNSTSLGLLSMRERASSIGASLIIASQPGDGTLVIIERPHGQTVTVDGAEAAAEQISGSGWSVAATPMGAPGS
jgi:signal transduction histidine kinase